MGEGGGENRNNEKIQILDLGCGDGINAVHIKQFFTHIEYYGIDISNESIVQAKKRNTSSGVHFKCYDGKQIPYQEEKFDMVFIACVLHHVPHEEHKNLLLECKRVLKENGSIFIFEHNPLNPVTRKIVNDCVFDQDAVLVHKSKLKRILRQIGLHHIKISYTIFFPRKGIFCKFLWMEQLLDWLPFGGQYFINCKK